MPVPGILRRSAAALLLATTGAPGAGAESQFVPVFQENFPDPHVIEHDGGFIAYATNAGINLPMAVSPDLVNWSFVMDPAKPGERLDGMPVLAPWVKEGFTWAPEVMKVGNRWLLYYTANHRERDVQCLGVAVADKATGPFRDASEAPLVCQFDLGGTIDANPFRDADGKLYLYYKSDGNRIGRQTYIWGQGLSEDGLRVIGDAVPLIKDDEAWEMKLVEAPAMIRSPAGYQLFYSAAYYGWNPEDRISPYATGYAICIGPLGPCGDAPENPILHSIDDGRGRCLSGPGHPSVFETRGRHYIAYHAWAATPDCQKAEDARYLHVAPLQWNGGRPQIGPSLGTRDSAERG